jgi:hypothetical protein
MGFPPRVEFQTQIEEAASRSVPVPLVLTDEALADHIEPQQVVTIFSRADPVNVSQTARATINESSSDIFHV